MRYFDSVFGFWKLKHYNLTYITVFYPSWILFEKLGTDLGQKSAFFKKSDYVIKNDVMKYFEYFSKGLSKIYNQSKFECYTINISKVNTNLNFNQFVLDL